MKWIVPAAFTSAVLLAWLWGPNLNSTATAEAAAQQQAPADEQEAVADGADQDEADQAEPEQAAEEPAEEASTGSEAPRDQAKSEGLEVFVPTEKLPAGSSVSFPVDI